METQTNGFIWTLLTRQKTKKHKNNLIKNKIERANTELNRELDSTKPQSQTRMFSRRKKTFLSFTLSLFYLFVAPVMQVLPVYAAEPAAALSVWEFMITQLLSANVVITDTAVNAAYASALSSLPAATATAAEIDAAIATAAVNCGVDLSTVFANTAASAASVGIEAGAATAGENLAASCAAYYANGAGSAVIPALGQAALDAAGVTGIIAGIAYICKMYAEDYGDIIRYGTKLDELSNMASMDMSLITVTGPGGLFTFDVNGTLWYGWGYVKGSQGFAVNSSNSSMSYSYGKVVNGVTTQYTSNLAAKSIVAVLGFYKTYVGKGIPLPDNYSIDYVNSHGGPALPYSPSVASTNGFQKYNPDYTPEDNPDAVVPYFPELKPLPEYENGTGLSPIRINDYNLLVNSLQNLGNDYTLEDQQGTDEDVEELIRPIITPYLVPLPSPEVNPQPTGTPDPEPTGSPDPQPTGSPNPNPNPKPNTKPFPDPESVPQVTPVVNPTPDSDVVPAPVPYPDPETPTEQDKTDTDTKITPIDLRDKFPFCIPFDMLKIMKLFQGGREAPCFTWTIPFGQAGSGEVTVDLSAWDSAATLLRTLELILFIMLLAVGTRNLIGGSS